MKKQVATSNVHRIKVALDRASLSGEAIEWFPGSSVHTDDSGALQIYHENLHVASVATGKWLWYKLEG